MILFAALLALMGTTVYLAKLQQAIDAALQLERMISPAGELITHAIAKLSVIIPAYNEVDNIRACLLSVLQTTDLSAEQLEVWVVDDQSQDETLAIVQALQLELADPRLHVLVGQPRPEQQTWVGKNWACTQAVQHATGEYLLFLDADVRLQPEAIVTALHTAQAEQIDLLSLGPAIVCGCLAEWLVQPLVVSLLVVGFDPDAVSDPSTDTAFAAGMFMLFRRSAYEQVGGHRAVADQVVEDVELARRIKRQGLTLRYVLGIEKLSVRMYRSWTAVWEGWTKNWHLGSGRNWRASLYGAVIVLLIFTVPWLGLIALLIKGAVLGLTWFDAVGLGVVLTTIALHYRLRLALERVAAIPPRYWWLTGVSGVLVAAIALGSIIKTETGWGWTWRGRSLKLPDEMKA
ncbi:glycosyltransferase family 2 protein [Leptolyngbya sp. FACHB-36]|uniref:glycosyltransferase n=1 Tax=Leptolyngbya sp. FACHB-36 TaxID=2692808 RepID=UPI001F54FB3A|nr:glycosyltransferase family 2 protein [Leptolyngbya sp. FACHB-36]